MSEILVAIANHGDGNRKYLDQLLEAYCSGPYECDIVILSDKPKQFGSDIEVAVGAPESNPWSLPFAHRPLFKERLEQYELFIYSEDDTLITSRNIDAFKVAVSQLNSNEIAGFMRTETAPDGSITYSTCHSFFRWVPNTVCERGGKLWATYSNEHSASFIATRNQLERGYRTGGFRLKAHEGRHDMLCSAATDIYSSSSLNRLVCIDDLEDFTLQHLPNKYIGKMGLPANEMRWHIEALGKINSGELSRAELFDPETRLPRAIGSKSFHITPDLMLERMIGTSHAGCSFGGQGTVFLKSLLKAEATM